ncbi:uncharacterized protein DNG_09431 [Cephalotrichum gorgonifer]|uniref:Uncharacterized protein n=1 Tax=Cephalotrichum gorgonifer TaxID=2041049 RepID=A0AAE8T043_9PEZI|nr:uncharacterized protein DNG_09431 [Cephalotrichum gorgonifer]
MSIEEVHVYFATATLVQDQNLKVLGLAPHMSIVQGTENTSEVPRLSLPSWVPDLISGGSVNPLISYTIRPRLFRAGGDTKDPITVSNNGTHLHLQGRIIDTIKTTATCLCDTPFPSDTDILQKKGFASMVKMRIRNWLRECAALTLEPGWLDRAPDVQWLAFARTILCDLTGMRDPLSEDVLATMKDYTGYVFSFFDPNFILSERVRESLFTHGPLIEQSILSMETRRFCTTQGGRLGMVRKEAREGDLICVVLGAEVPFTIRPTGTGTHALIGDSFILGTM